MCSRDSAPDQKYYERLLHRGRPRLRKRVEVSKTKPITSNSPTTTTTSLSTSFPSQSSGIFPKDRELKFPFQPLEPNKETRCLDWIKGSNEEMESNLQWELMHSKTGLSSSNTRILQNFEDHS